MAESFWIIKIYVELWRNAKKRIFFTWTYMLFLFVPFKIRIIYMQADAGNFFIIYLQIILSEIHSAMG